METEELIERLVSLAHELYSVNTPVIDVLKFVHSCQLSFKLSADDTLKLFGKIINGLK